MSDLMDAESRFRALFVDAYPALRGYARHRGLSPADADDLVAEVLAIAWRRLDAVPADDARPWLFATARNVWRNGLRSGRRRADLVHRLPRPEPQGPPPEPADHSTAEIRAALAGLDDHDQEILRLVAWDGLTTRQLALALDCTEAAARVRLHRARGRFADRLGPRGNGAAVRDRSSGATQTEGPPR